MTGTDVSALRNALVPALDALDRGEVEHARAAVARAFAVVDHAARAADPIRIWRYKDAPAELRAACPGSSETCSGCHGGDEDWLVHVPAAFDDALLPWMEQGGWIGCFSVCEHRLPDGSRIRVGAH